MPLLRLVDLFAGTGAFSLAFEETGNVQVVFANDFSAAAKNIYDANLGHPLTLRDLNEIAVTDIPGHDILTAGFPCQPFSIAGEQSGFDDPRSNVFWKILEIIDHHQPRCVVLENVKNILTHDNRRTFRIICDALRERQYLSIQHRILDTAKHSGIPQHRERMYMIASKTPIPADLLDRLPEVPRRPLEEFIDLTLTQHSHPKYYYSDQSKIWPALQHTVTDPNVVYQYRRTLVRENKSGLCPTLTANMGTGGHNVPLIRVADGIRKLTPRECFSLQGFPQSYSLSTLSDAKLYKLAGNAVSYPIVQRIAQSLVHAIN